MKKKICLLLCVLIASFSFVGCAGKDQGIDAQTLNQAKITGEYFTQSFSAMGSEGFAQFLEMDAFNLDLALYSINASGAEYGYPELLVDSETFIAMIKAWMAAEDECGTFRSYDEFKVEQKKGNIVVSTTAKFMNEAGKEREADLVFTFDSKLNVETFDISAHYSTGEILKKAGLNTLLGMGTVFAVLIFLAFIISLMKYIPMFIDKMNNKAPANVEMKEAKQEEVVDVTDDLELVAVIAAAIAAAEGTSTDGFVVRSIRRRPNNNWK